DLAGLLIGVPLYWLFGINGIVPAIICMSAAMYFFYSHTLKKCRIPHKNRERPSSNRPLVRKLLSLGLILVVGNLVTTGSVYFINLFIRSFGDIENVGYFQAANSITMQYVGIVFSAMAVDYLPRLSRNISDNSYVSDLANRQITLLTYIVTPIVIGMILTAPMLIRLLLTHQFENITGLIRWMGLGVLFRAINYPLGYITFAKDNRKIYIWTEVIFYNIVNIALSCTAYYLYGLIGLGAAVIANGIIGITTDYLVQRKLYSFRFSKTTLINLIVSTFLSVAVFAISFSDSPAAYALMSIIFIISCTFSFRRIRAALKNNS
ncbi:MAG: oligosaccharide flippase family protein, partial [Paramuribaculum sp.]|nr:oligosaccharide flippase family protein [Paramuribaculum sp.]